jgi:hypothetical protein
MRYTISVFIFRIKINRLRYCYTMSNNNDRLDHLKDPKNNPLREDFKINRFS